jgi:hypothetical protein
VSISILASILALAWSPDSTGISLLPEGWILGYDCLVEASADGCWKSNHPVMDSTALDAAVSVSLLSPEVDFLITGALRSDSSTDVSFRRGRGVVRWPGTPWIGAGVFKNDQQPFIAGLSDPVVEWGWIDIDSVQGFGLSSGGILGFNGNYLIQLTEGDTLSQLNVHSPWMGFVGFDYSRAQIHTSDSMYSSSNNVHVISARGDFRYFNPWLSVAGSDGEEGKWAVSAAIRDFSPFNTDWGRIELVPEIHFAGDEIEFPGNAYSPGQRIIALGAFLESRRYFLSAGIKGMIDLSSDSLSGVSTSAGLISESGIEWGLAFDCFADGDYYATLSSIISDSYSSAGVMLEILNDSTRVTGSASYSPRDDVCAIVSMSGDVDDSLQPSCELAVSAALGPMRGLLGINWDYRNSPSLRINLRGLL